MGPRDRCARLRLPAEATVPGSAPRPRPGPMTWWATGASYRRGSHICCSCYRDQRVLGDCCASAAGALAGSL